MMKNKKMGILAVLVMLVAVTLNAVGGTYAKYISAYSMTDEARVAKWDFDDVSVNNVDLFQSSYTKTKDGKDYTYVASKDASKVVAPGTSGEYSYKITGTAETNYKATRTVKVLNRIAIVGDYYMDGSFLGELKREGDYEKGKVYYNPIEFRVTDASGAVGNWEKATKFEYDDSGKFLGLSLEIDFTNDNKTIYPANYEITNELSGKIEWRWAFEQAGTPDEVAASNLLDTNLALLVTNYNADLTMNANIGVVVEQTQEPATVTGTSGVSNVARRVVFGNRIPESYSELKQKETGYNTLNNEDVIFNGTSLKGTIYKTKNAVADRFNKLDASTPATGYYYPIMVTAYAEDGIDIQKITITTASQTVDVENEYGNIMYLTPADKTNGIKYTVTYSDNTTKDFVLDLSELTFSENENTSHNGN